MEKEGGVRGTRKERIDDGRPQHRYLIWTSVSMGEIVEIYASNKKSRPHKQVDAAIVAVKKAWNEVDVKRYTEMI